MRTLPLQRTHGLGVRPVAVPGDEVVDDGGAEGLLQIEREVRDPERVGKVPGADHRLRGAAALRAVGVTVGPQLHRHGRHVGAGPRLHQRRDGRVDAAAHRHQHPLATGGRSPERLAGGGGRGERAVKRVGGELGRVAPLRGEAAEGLPDPGRADPRDIEDREPPGEIGGGRSCRLRGSAALGVEARGVDAVGDRASARSAPDRRRVRRRPRP